MPKKTDKKTARKPALKDLDVPKAQGAKIKGGISVDRTVQRADDVATKAIKRLRNR